MTTSGPREFALVRSDLSIPPAEAARCDADVSAVGMAHSGPRSVLHRLVPAQRVDRRLRSPGVTIFLSGRVFQRISRNSTLLPVRIPGHVLTAIAVTLLVCRGARMIHSLVAILE